MTQYPSAATPKQQILKNFCCWSAALASFLRKKSIILLRNVELLPKLFQLSTITESLVWPHLLLCSSRHRRD